MGKSYISGIIRRMHTRKQIHKGKEIRDITGVYAY